VLGAALGWKRRMRRFSTGVEVLLGVSALGIVALSWILALRRG